MTLAIDSVSGYELAQSVETTSVSWKHTCSGSNRLLFVGVSTAGAAGKVSGVKFNGVAMTNKWDAVASSGNVTGWILVAPDTGEHDIEVTFSSNTTQWAGPHGFCGISFTGADQSTPTGDAVTGSSGYSTSVSVTATTASGEIVVDAAKGYLAAITIGADQTIRYGTSGTTQYGFSTQPGDSGGAMSWTTATNQWIAIGAISIKPASEAAGLALPIIQNYNNCMRH